MDHVLLLEVDVSHVKLIGTDHFVSDVALVHHFDADSTICDKALVLISELKEEMFTPLDWRRRVARLSFFGSRVLCFATDVHNNDRINCRAKSHNECKLIRKDCYACCFRPVSIARFEDKKVEAGHLLSFITSEILALRDEHLKKNDMVR